MSRRRVDSSSPLKRTLLPSPLSYPPYPRPPPPLLAVDVAAQAGFADIALALIDAGANLEAGDEWNCTPLHWACHCGHRDVTFVRFDSFGCLPGQ